jgi:hypothetical protein
VCFGRFLPERHGHSASDLVVPIGPLAARLCAMRSVQLFPRGADASFGAVAPWLMARHRLGAKARPGQDEPMTNRLQRSQLM